MMKWLRAVSLAAMLGALAAVPHDRAVAADDTIKIGYIDPFSGPFAMSGDQFLQVFHFIIDYVNSHSPPLGKKFELVTFDDKLQPAEAMIALKNVVDQNMPFVMSCVGSNVGSAMIQAVAKNNERNPDRRIIYLNCGALATELTNAPLCNFWHFRFTGSVQQRAYARIKSLPADVKKVYLINQDYLFGHSIEHDTKEFLTKLRPDIQIVGDEFVPLGQVKDFSPYITKIKDSGAQSVITGNYGPDLNLLMKAAVDAGLNIRFDTYLAYLTGAVTAIGKTGADRMTVVMEYNENLPVELNKPDAEQFDLAFRKDHKFDFVAQPWVVMFEMLSRAINQAGSLDTYKIAKALEGMQQTDLVGATETMRAEDHQLILPYYEGLLTKDVKYDTEGTGLGFKTIATIPAAEEEMPTTCNMQRPSS
ncbi:MAG TPA: branched-chain amino acid ABC transporter substrate-binding protein [Acetobacteraceae bacterium]|nr:branched-chain amino acid ABC transporter substrate-binding protein [Acetobacteraceae bacterium]